MDKKGIGLRLKMIIMIVVFALILGFTLIIAIRYFVKDRIMEDYSESAWEISSAVGANIDTHAVNEVKKMCREIYAGIPEEERFSSSYWGTDEWYEYLDHFKIVEEIEAYKKLEAYMKDSLAAMEMGAVYIGCAFEDSDSGDITYMYLVDPIENEDKCPVGTFERMIDPTEEQLAHPELGYRPYVTNTEEYGWLMTCGTPLMDGDEVAGYMYIDVPMNDVMETINSFTVFVVAFVVILTLVLVLGYLFVVDRVIISPINKLSGAAICYIDNKEENDNSSFQNLNIRSRDEIGQLFTSMKQMEQDINEHIESISKLTAEKERTKTELRVAQNIQHDMLPSNFRGFCESRNIDIYGVMIPAKEVGGDFYDFFKIDKERIGLIIADVSGKGVPAALLMAVAKSMLRVRAVRGGKPGEILEDVNTWLCENNESEQFITAFLGILNMKTGNMEYANAGHEYPIIINGEMASVLQGENDPPLAAVSYIVFRNMEMNIKHGDRLLLYTDGVPEAKSANGSRYGMERLQRMLRHSAGAREAVEKIKNDVLDFTGSESIFDDVTMLCIEYLGNEGQE